MFTSFKRRFLLASIFLIPTAAMIGYRAGRTEFRSVGVVRINPVLPKILYPTAANEPLPDFDNYMETEKARIQSRRIIEIALSDPTFGELTPLTPDRLADELTVAHEGELLKATVWDGNPIVAREAVEMVVRAYALNYEEERMKSQERVQTLLRDGINTQRADVQNINAEIAALSIKYGFVTDDLQAIFAEKQKELADLTTQSAELRQSYSATSPAVTAVDTKAHRLTEELAQIGSDQMKLDDLKAEKTGLMTRLNTMRDRYDAIAFENNNGQNSRLEVISEGETPTRSADIRSTHAQFASLGGIAGLAASAMLATALGWRRRIA